MNVVDRTGKYGTPWTWPNHDRPIQGAVLHHTATAFVPTPKVGASWHYCIAKDGTVYEDVPLAACAHHVLNCDRWRPAWVVKSRVGVSDVNYSSVGIEIVYAPQLGETPTAAQYDALLWLAADLEARCGALWWIGHRDVQADKIDPQPFDWDRAGFGPPDGKNGRAFVAREQGDDEVSPEDQAIVDVVRGLGANADSIVGWINEIGALTGELETASLEVQALRGQLENPPPAPRVLRVVNHLFYEDGHEQELAA
jgi:hypothetical protein